MGKQSLEKFCTKLFGNLLEETIFYIPNTLFPDELLIEHDLIDLKKHFQKLIYMDKMRGPMYYTDETNKPDILEKASLLKKNILSLIEKRTKLDKDGFNYIFKNYYDQARAMYYIATWINNNERFTFINYINSTAINKILLQEQLFEEHLLKLNAIFNNSIKETNQKNNSIAQNLELQSPTLFKHLKGIDISLKENKESIDKLIKASFKYEKTPLSHLTTPKKNILITESEANEFLLETVFGIKLQ